MDGLRIFKDDRFGEIRWVKVNNKDYAIGKDVAKCLGYVNPRDAIIRHCKGVVKHDSFKEGGQCVSLIPEGDIFRCATCCYLKRIA
jgi:prophage antirepressor-like protein